MYTQLNKVIKFAQVDWFSQSDTITPICKANKNHNNNDCKTSLIFLLPFDLHTYNDTLGFN